MQSLDKNETNEWHSISGWHVAGLALFVAYISWQHFLTDSQWVFLLDHTNLALHEAGHPIIGMFSNRMAVYGGTIFQLLFPLAFAAHFWRQRHGLGTALSCVWFGENLLNIGRYMADARARELPLVGGGVHDWTEIFSRWGMLASDTQIAGMTRVVGLLIMLYALAWIGRCWRQNPRPSPMPKGV